MLDFLAYMIIFLLLIKVSIHIIPCLYKKQNLCMKYNNNYAIVTGGTDGIGYEIFQELQNQGFNVLIIGRNQEKINKNILKNQSKAFYGDLSDVSAVNYIKNWIIDNNPSVLVHSAGSCVPSSFIKINDPDKYLKSYINSMIEITRIFLNTRKEKGGIVFFSSQVSFFSNPYASLYAATKAFIEQFGRSIAMEHQNLDILTVIPGAVNGTSFFDKFPNFWFFNIIRFLGTERRVVSDIVFKCLGRINTIDIGIYTYLTRFVVCFIDNNVLDLIAKKLVSPISKYF